MIMTTDTAGVEFIAGNEGFSPTPYPDPATKAEPYTIAFGTTVYPNGTTVTMEDAPVTREQGIVFLMHHVNTYIDPVLSKIVTLPQNRHNAIADFMYNEGKGCMEGTGIARMIVATQDNPEIRSKLMEWVYAGGHPMKGLAVRRKKEADLYFKPAT